ncbi:hypothetical protein BDV06DRAFT_46183 [Aspergillus oleicola]
MARANTARPDSETLGGTDCPVILIDASYKSVVGQPLPCAQPSQLANSPANCSSVSSVNALSSIRNSNPAGSDGQSSATRRMHHFHIALVWVIEQLQHSFRWMRRLLRIDPQDQRLRQIEAGDIQQGGFLNGDRMGPRPAFELEPQRGSEAYRGFLPNTSNDFVERYSFESGPILVLPSSAGSQ